MLFDFNKHQNNTNHALKEIAAVFDKYVRFPSDAARIATILWTAHTHVYQQFQFTPRITVMSGESATGKTTVMDILSYLTPNGKVTVYPQPAVIMRKAESESKVTFLFDEIQKKLGSGGSRNSSSDFQSVILAGFQKGGTVERSTGSDAWRDYHVFAPMALCGRGVLADDLMNRAINIHMRKMPDNEQLEDFRPSTAQYALDKVYRTLDAWSRSSGDVLEFMAEDPPAKGRRADIWQPLIAIAEMAGPEWLRAATDACRTLESIDHGNGETDVPLSVKMLRHIEDVFHDTETGEPVKGMATDDIIAHLVKMGWDSRVLNPKSLSKVLGEFDIGPTKFRDESGDLISGYTAVQFDGLWGHV